MALPAAFTRGPVPRFVTAVVLALPRGITRLRRSPPPEGPALVGLVLLAVLLVVGGEMLGKEYVPPASQVLPLLGGSLLLRRKAMRALLLVVAGCLAYALFDMKLLDVRPGALVVVLVTAAVSYEFSRSREETGLSGSSGDTFVVELRQRLQRQGELPRLPSGWRGEAVLSPAGGGPFAGDFVVSALRDEGRCLELALVDVSGKGIEAGTRALLLSGALGGLLGSVRSDGFLPSANRYLDRQEWDEGFATAVHLVVDLVDGSFSVESAGHPPVALFDAGSGRWSLLGAHGVALGLLPEASYEAVTGRLDRGDALILYTDGLVEVPGRDLEVGIDKLLGEAERLVPHGFTGGGQLLVSRVATAGTDDRGLVLLWRDT
ncbi:MAG: Integral membrane protein [uncultured Frankineae bacterium]|uniref:Integral membrane protein n=1 Tax=uncultured Frankineae bacterium TaxID=437475 RepID=A0A6J4KP67_9ACTN|nr:MAG: Integral membrane protein [uncultured Frankineae bacterium]